MNSPDAAGDEPESERLPLGDWLPVPEAVATLLGRFTYYAAWLDDVLGEAVVLGNPDATELSESTPNWAGSGKALVAGVRSIRIDHPFIGDLADRLEGLNRTRNQLVHGVWMWKDDQVLVMKRSLSKGQRRVEYATYKYTEIEAVIEQYQQIGRIVDRLVALLMKGNSNHAKLVDLQTPRCPNDGEKLQGHLAGEVIVWKCPACEHAQSAD